MSRVTDGKRCSSWKRRGRLRHFEFVRQIQLARQRPELSRRLGACAEASWPANPSMFSPRKISAREREARIFRALQTQLAEAERLDRAFQIEEIELALRAAAPMRLAFDRPGKAEAERAFLVRIRRQKSTPDFEKPNAVRAGAKVAREHVEQTRAADSAAARHDLRSADCATSTRLFREAVA